MLKLLAIICIATLSFAQDAIPNFQYEFSGAKARSLGETSPAIQGDLSTVFNNPATLAYTRQAQFTMMSQRLLGAFDYLSTGYSMPIMGVQTAISYGSLIANGIHRTELVDDRVESRGTFESGFRVLQGSAAVPLGNLYILQNVAVGVNAKYYQQVIDNDTRTGIGADAGIQGDFPLTPPLIDRLHLGATFVNAFSQFDQWSGGQGGSEEFERDVLLGAHAELLNRRLHLYGHTHPDETTMFGAEYNLSPDVFLRGGSNMEFERYSMGLGIQVRDVIRTGKHNYHLRLDYNMSMITEHSDLDTHTFSVTMLGETGRQRPVIKSPKRDFSTNQKTVALSGLAPAGSEVMVYTNEALQKSTRATSRGDWSMPDYPIKPGTNVITARAYTIHKSYTLVSKPLRVASDQKAPILTAQLAVLNASSVQLTAVTDEPAKLVSGRYLSKSVAFKQVNPTTWTAQIGLHKSLQSGQTAPEQIASVKLHALDQVGNKSELVEVPFFASVIYPKDKSIVYKRFTTVIGRGSPALKSLKINDQPVKLDAKSQFAAPIYLKPGRNNLRIVATPHEGPDITYKLRVKSLTSFKDLTDKLPQKRAIERVASVGLMRGENGLFHPHKQLTRLDMARFLVQLKRLRTPRRVDTLLDVPAKSADAQIVQAVRNKKLMGLMGKRQFGSKKPIPEMHAVYALIKADILTKEQLPLAKKGAVLTRKRLAEFLTQSKALAPRFESLNDW